MGTHVRPTGVRGRARRESGDKAAHPAGTLRRRVPDKPGNPLKTVFSSLFSQLC